MGSPFTGFRGSPSLLPGVEVPRAHFSGVGLFSQEEK